VLGRQLSQTAKRYRVQGLKTSDAWRSVAGVISDASLSEVEKVLLHVSDARGRAAQAAERLEKAGVDPSVTQCLREAQRDLDELHRRLAQGTYYALGDDRLTLAV
jgi:hypothetical protein